MCTGSRSWDMLMYQYARSGIDLKILHDLLKTSVSQSAHHLQTSFNTCRCGDLCLLLQVGTNTLQQPDCRCHCIISCSCRPACIQVQHFLILLRQRSCLRCGCLALGGLPHLLPESVLSFFLSCALLPHLLQNTSSICSHCMLFILTHGSNSDD